MSAWLLRPSPAGVLPASVLLTWLFTVVQPATAQVSTTQVKRAMRAAVQALRARQNDDGAWTEHDKPGGYTCLATLALLNAGEDPRGPALAAALRHVRALPNQWVYVTSLKLMVLARADPEAYRAEIVAAATWLTEAQNSTGLWDYRADKSARFDHSNSQFALLGLHAAAQAGAKIPPAVWQRARARVLDTQGADGGWSYQAAADSYGSMTAAGVVDLLILGATLERGRESGFHAGAAPQCGKYTADKPLLRGLEWLARNFRPDRNPGRDRAHVYYWLYTVERCGILSGQRYFGRHDWYREGAAYLVTAQDADGTWNNSLVDTCFALLFLAKGRAPLLIQKLQWSADDEWNPDRHDVANLVAAIGDQLGEPVAWQTVAFEAPLEDWLAAPLLYFHGHTFPRWNAAQRAKLRDYVQYGGTLLAEACCGRDEFRAGFEAFAAQTFPEAPLRELGPDHAVYRVLHEVKLSGWPYPGGTPGVRGIDFGCRTAVLYCPKDLSCLWEQADVPAFSERAFELGANIAAYATGRRPLRERLDAVVLPTAPPAATDPPRNGALQLAQVVYEGDWRTFPLALPGLAEFLRDELNMDVVTRPAEVRLDDPALFNYPVLYLAGHFDFETTAAQRAALAEHLRRGGTLIADACCGTEPFETALRRMLRETFPDAQLERLSADHALFAGAPGFDVRAVQYAPDVRRARPGLSTPELWGLALDGRLAVLYSPFSLSCGLSGPAFEGCWGLAREDAQRLAANILLHALTQ